MLLKILTSRLYLPCYDMRHKEQRAVMDQGRTQKPARPWRVVAEEVSRGYDADKMALLMKELNQILEEQGLLALGMMTG
jgi:hypothetical protein